MSKKCTPVWREAHFEVKMYKTHHSRTTFGSWDVEKVHAVVARSTFRSQNVKNTTCSDNFWKLRCPKSARRCCAKQSKVSKTWGFCSIFNYHHYTTLHSNSYTTLQLQLHLHYILLHSTALHCTQLHYTTLHYITVHYTSLHYTTLHYTTLPSTTLHYITLHYTPEHYNYNYTTTLHYTKLHYTTPHHTTLH